MKGIILAGGFGTRLRPLTVNLAKPMAPMANRPMLEHVVNLCRRHKIQDLLFMLHYSPDHIKRHFQNGQDWDMAFSYLRPDLDLGTAGCVRFASEQPDHRSLTRENFIVLSGDVLADLDLSLAIRFHEEKKALATLILTKAVNPLAYGVVITDQSGRIIRFLEKPTWGQVFSDTINTGLYILSPDIFTHIPAAQPFDFSKNMFPKLLERNLPVYGYVADGYWKDVGDLTEYRLAHMDILDNKVRAQPFGVPLSSHPHVRVGENCEIESGVDFKGNVFIGKNCRIAHGAQIEQSVIGDNVRIASGASIRKSVVWGRAFIGPEAQIREAIVGRSVRVGQRARIEVGAVVANRCDIGNDALLRPGVKMWPEKVLEDGAALSSSLIWGERWNRQIFGTIGISGLANIEVTPEFAAKLGAAYGAFLGAGSYVITSRDAHKISRLIKRAFISGLLSTGVRVGDLRLMPIPVIRYEMGKEAESGGMHVRLSPLNPRQIDIRIFDADGNDLPPNREKALEQLFMREDFKRAPVDDVGEITVPPQTLEYYRAGFLKSLDKSLLSERKFKVVVDYAHSAAAQILPDLLDQLGIESVALNTAASPEHVTRTAEEFEQAKRVLKNMVKTLNADAGFLLDNGAEKVFIVDEQGELIEDQEALVLLGLLSVQSNTSDIICYPIQCTSVLEKMVAQRGVPVIKTQMNPRNLLAYAKRPNVGFVGDGEGGFIFPKFQSTFDGMFAIARILELMAEQRVKLGELRREIPGPIHVQHRRVPCSWGRKGQVMRLAQKTAEGQEVELVDGVKIHKKGGWILVMPDGNQAYCHLWAEGADEGITRAFLDEYTRKVDEWQKWSSEMVEEEGGMVEKFLPPKEHAEK